MLLIDTFIQKINENSQFRINYEKEGLINMMGINKEEVERMYELKYINKNAIFNQPIQIAYNTQFDKIIEKNSSVDKTELIHFLRDVQILFMGVFTRDINEELFDNDNLSFTKNRIFTDLSKDITGEKYLSKQEIKRVLNLYKPLNPKEKDEIYEKEEEIVSYWENLPSHVKAELLQNESKIFPSNIIAEYDSGFPEKSFKITDPNVNFAETIEKLNKSAENGVYYTHINDKKNGDFIMRAVRPSFQLNLRKIADLDLKELKEKGIKQLGVSNEKAEQIIKELENLWKAGRFNQLNVLENIDKSQIEELLKTTKMTWEGN